MVKNDPLTVIHKNVIRVALEIRKKNRAFNVITIFNRCCQQLPYPEPEIEGALRDLLEWKYIVLGKYLVKSEILANEKRRDMYQYISQYPGAHEREIKNVCNLGAYETRVHLAYLIDFNFIRRGSYKNRNVFFPIDFEKSKELETVLLRTETTMHIYECIKSNQALRLSEIAELTQIPYTTIQSQLIDLIEAGLIEKIQEGSTTFYRVPQLSSFAEQLEVKREYDYVGGKIRFKLAVRNFTSMVIHNISINLNPSDQFIAENPLQVISNLPPNTTRGVDFDLTPLSCGQSKIFGAVSYQDAYGKAHSITIEPKEISIKCPLVTPLMATQSEVNEWIQSLKRGTSRISYQQISDTEAFRIGREQVSALDLTEITTDKVQLQSLYSGQVKVTGQNTVIRLSIANPNIVLDVWAEDMKQTTGFLAYISNLINIALEASYKMARKTEDLTKKILNLVKVSGILDQLILGCQNFNPIHDLASNISNTQAHLQESNPDSVLIQPLQLWNSKLLGMYDPQDTLSDLTALELQYHAINWFGRIQELIQTHMKMYRDAFDDLNQISEDLCSGIETINERIIEHQKAYGQKILAYLLILDKRSGITLFEKNLGTLQINPDLIGGFLHALQSFGTEISPTETSMKTLTYENYHFQIENGEYARIALILRGKPNDYLIAQLEEFTKKFESNFKDQIVNFTGNMDVFSPVNSLFESTFYV